MIEPFDDDETALRGFLRRLRAPDQPTGHGIDLSASLADIMHRAAGVSSAEHLRRTTPAANVKAAQGAGQGGSATFTHECLFYRDERSYLDGVLPFVEEALATDTPVLVAVPGGNGVLLRHELGWRAEKMSFLDMSIEGRNPNRIIPAVLDAFISEHAGRPVAIIGEAIWPGRSATEYPACVQHEALINMAFDGALATILCPYDTRGLEPEVLADAASTHPILTSSGERQTSRSYGSPKQVFAEFNRPLSDPPRSAASMAFDDTDDLPRLREFVGRHADASGLSDDRLVDLQMAANEIATNTIRHSGGPGIVQVWAEDGHVVCDVSDGGHIADPLVGRLASSVGGEHGRGLLVINYLCDLVRVHTEPGSTSIRLFMHVSA